MSASLVVGRRIIFLITLSLFPFIPGSSSQKMDALAMANSSRAFVLNAPGQDVRQVQRGGTCAGGIVVPWESGV